MSAGLNFSQIVDLAASMRTDIRNGFSDSQLLVRYPLQRTFMAHAQTRAASGDSTYSWDMRMRAGPGPVPNKPYRQRTANLDTNYMARCLVKYLLYVDDNMVWDSIELELNKKTPEKIWDIVKGRYSFQREGIANWLERQFMGLPANADDDQQMLSLRYWARRSIDSSGNFVENKVGSFDGTYIKYGDGSVSAVIANRDASTTFNERLRTWCGTHDGVMDYETAELCKKCQDDMGWEFLPDLKGEANSGTLTMFLDQQFNQQYENLVSKGPDFRGTQGGSADLFPFRNFTLNGAKRISVPKLKDDPGRPIYFADLNELSLKKVRNLWDNARDPILVPGTHTTYWEPTDFMGQIFCEQSPRHAVAVIHGNG